LPRSVVLSYFHTHKGPQVLHAIPPDLSEDKETDLCRTLDFLENEGFFVQQYTNYKTANLYFEIPSDWARGNAEMVLVTLIMEDDDTNPASLEGAFQSLVSAIREVPSAYKSLYEGIRQDPGVSEASAEVREILNEFLASLPAEIPPRETSAIKLFVFGLDRAGKTSIVRHMQSGSFLETQPTTRANIIRLLFNQINLVCFDMAGQRRFRNSWNIFLKNPSALIFVVDVTDPSRFEEAVVELHRVVESPNAGNAPMLVFANKIDLADHNNYDKEKLITALRLNAIDNRKWKIIESSAKTRKGLDEGFNWILARVLNI
jgi:small GTP-binding protein